MNGGLGNQMFQIAAAYAYAKQHNGQLCLQQHKESDDRRPLYWDTVFAQFSNNLITTIPAEMPRAGEQSATVYTTLPPLTATGMHLLGYFQTPLYFDHVRDEIASAFRASHDLVDSLRAKHADLLAQTDRIVVVHARRTDYCADEYAKQVHGPLSIAYYNSAMERMALQVPDTHFLLVADDNNFWKQLIHELPVLQTTSYSILDEPNEVRVLALLQQFRYFIMANSTFSWWAAWLADEPKQVIAPAQWCGPRGHPVYEDVYETDWCRIASI